MASKVYTITALLLSLNLLFLSLVSGTHYVPCPPPPFEPPPIEPPPIKPPPCYTCKPPVPVKPPPIKPPPCNTCTPPGPVSPSCPRDALKLGVCANVLNLLKLKVGSPPKYPCCSLLEGLADLEAAVCLCTAIKANLLGINLNIPVDLSLLVNYCGKKVPAGFKCA